MAHPARVHDYWLGGKDNFPADPGPGRAHDRAIPNMRAMAAANRAFLSRAVRYLAEEAGIRQFLDIGTGIPTSPNGHQVAQEAAPDARVVYVDNDPTVLAHARPRPPDPGRDPRPEPAGWAPDRGRADVLPRRREPEPLRDRRHRDGADASGSYLAVTHPTPDFNPEETAKAVVAAEAAGITLVPRGRAEVAEFFTGLDLVGPGLTPVLSWRPEEPPVDPRVAYYWAGIARKP